jgi:hypothetical protein
MAEIEARLAALGLQLPAPIQLPPGVKLSFPWARIHGDRAYVRAMAPWRRTGRWRRCSARSARS